MSSDSNHKTGKIPIKISLKTSDYEKLYEESSSKGIPLEELIEKILINDGDGQSSNIKMRQYE